MGNKSYRRISEMLRRHRICAHIYGIFIPICAASTAAKVLDEGYTG
jgi:hypothetical protein